jgi:hypothetical protein
MPKSSGNADAPYSPPSKDHYAENGDELYTIFKNSAIRVFLILHQGLSDFTKNRYCRFLAFLHEFPKKLDNPVQPVGLVNVNGIT